MYTGYVERDLDPCEGPHRRKHSVKDFLTDDEEPEKERIRVEFVWPRELGAFEIKSARSERSGREVVLMYDEIEDLKGQILEREDLDRELREDLDRELGYDLCWLFEA